jgi:hypothetical protein
VASWKAQPPREEEECLMIWRVTTINGDVMVGQDEYIQYGGDKVDGDEGVSGRL